MAAVAEPARCVCGRMVKRLNPPYSDEAKCVGCGYLPELCRCRHVQEAR